MSTSIAVRGLNVLSWNGSDVSNDGTHLDEARVHDILDAIDGDTGLGDVGSKDDFACVSWWRLEDDLLFFWRQCGVQWQSEDLWSSTGKSAS